MADVGSMLPDIELVDTELKPVKLSSTKGKATVIAFFPGAFTGVCTKEMCTFRDGLEKLKSLNANIIAISVDSPFSNKAFKEKHNLNFTILSDYEKKAIKEFGIELPNFAHLKGYTAAKRSVFVVDKGGTISYKWVSDDPTTEPNYDVVMNEISKVK